MDGEVDKKLEQRLGRLHARLRLGIEQEQEGRVLGVGLNLFHIENLIYSHTFIRGVLKATGLYWLGRRNCTRIQVRHNTVRLANLPPAFEGFTLLHLSDLHVDMSESAMYRLIELLHEVDYDACVLTGDYRAATSGPYQAALDGMQRIRTHLKNPVYAVLGNHDTIRMVPGLEEMGIRMLLNESCLIDRDGQHLHLVGIDDAHYYRVDNIEKAVSGIPEEACSILLTHTPEIFRQAAHANFDLLLCGHTHGGQICLPGRVPITLDSVLPRYMGSGAWKYHHMTGYTSVGAGASVVDARFNCPPEISLHHLERG